MKSLQRSLKTLALAGMLTVPAAAHAVEFFAGANIHNSMPDCAGCQDHAGLAGSIGVRFIPYLGLEGRLQTFGQDKYEYQYGNSKGSDTFTTASVSFGLIGAIPLGSVVRLEWRAGAHAWGVGRKQESCYRNSSGGNWYCDENSGRSDDGVDPYAGLGVEFLVSNLISVEGQYTRFRFSHDGGGKENVDNAGVGIRFRF